MKSWKESGPCGHALIISSRNLSYNIVCSVLIVKYKIVIIEADAEKF